MLTLASAFLYALLTNRVLLIHTDASMNDLFCEPFPHTSWLLPSDFPMKGFPKFSSKSPRCYGKMLRREPTANSNDDVAKQRLPAYVYLHLFHDYDDFDMHFFCEDDQKFLRKIPWLVIGSDNYFAPSLFSIPSYEEELSRLFPKRDTVFHHLGRYLFHPTNTVWGMITRYYQAYLAKAKERLGIQIRIFNRGSPFIHILDQILACSLRENLLPDINIKEPIVSITNKAMSKAVLLTCLHSEVYEKMKTMYYEHPAVTGEIIGVYQPSHEQVQQTKGEMHNKKAWAEIYLLSLTDVLVTSAWSTFGYVAQGLGGLKPWILIRSDNMTMPDPPCRRALSMDPCFHNPPTCYCNGKTDVDEVLGSHVRHCEDMSSGLKLVDEA
ncbi:putative Galactoside 2-alpha-L-fucosyltransferase [Cocos nucifera]|uniref:Fucosyltransferase n=1 Tax=Cocos nucifera TaxID=13894 RepID=A0A8K0N1Z2_COCNU|nr:putative Galactoside 2-alpha-L-fucosyltransferase [Cocos nucifera]